MGRRTVVQRLRKKISKIELDYSRRFQTGIKRLPRTKTCRSRLDPFKIYKREDEFLKRFRLPRRVALGLAKEFAASPACTTKGTRRGGAIKIRQKICYALRYLATGASYQVIRDTQGGCSRSTVGRCIEELVKFLVMRSRHHIKFPEGLELHMAACKFAKLKKTYRQGFNKCIGAVDGTYIPIQKPIRNEGAFVCRKGFHALNCQVVVDADMRFLSVDAGSPGSQHDSTVWSHSHVGQLVESGRLGDYYLLGDNAYTQSKFVMTPFTAPELQKASPAEHEYQKAHTSARSIVERSIGQLKGRWRCLSRHGSGVLRHYPVYASMIFVACCVLHNICIEHDVTDINTKNNKDPDAEIAIRLTAAKRLLQSYQQIRRSGVVPGPAPHAKSKRKEGVTARKRLIQRLFTTTQTDSPAATAKRRHTRRK